MSKLRERMIRDMQLRRLSEKTQESYVHGVKSLAKHYMLSPDQLSDHQVQDFILHLLNERQLAWSTCNTYLAGMQFFYGTTLGRASTCLALPPRRKDQRLPEILSSEELTRLFGATTNVKHRVLLMTTYSCGLRSGEVRHLKVADIDSDRMTLHIRQAKGRKDRYVTISPRLLQELRAYWNACRPRGYLFPGQAPDRPMPRDTPLRIYKRTAYKADIRKAGGIHALRHSYATHMLEAGVDLRTLQVLMGHHSILTTQRYLRVTRKNLGAPDRPLDLLAIAAQKQAPPA